MHHGHEIKQYLEKKKYNKWKVLSMLKTTQGSPYQIMYLAGIMGNRERQLSKIIVEVTDSHPIILPH